MRSPLAMLVLLSLCLALTPAAAQEEPVRDYTCFQTASPWLPEIDVASDVAVVYGVN